MKAVLVRVGIGYGCGGWHGPCNPHNNEFVYVAIPEDSHENVPGMERPYSSLVPPALAGFSERNDCNVALPQRLQGRRMHLDPDFEQLSYGDTDKCRRHLDALGPGDLMVFCTSLCPIHPTRDNLVYALIGMFTVARPVQRVSEIPDACYDSNAHSRRQSADKNDRVVYGAPKSSGRFRHAIPIGERRGGMYRVCRPILEQWGHISSNDGYIQRKGAIYTFNNPPKFQTLATAAAMTPPAQTPKSASAERRGLAGVASGHQSCAGMPRQAASDCYADVGLYRFSNSWRFSCSRSWVTPRCPSLRVISSWAAKPSRRQCSASQSAL